jgi:nucleoside-diphosphate-sugar epimerase
MTRLIFGCGYLGRRVARRWLDAGQRVVAVTRSALRAAELKSEGIDPLVADIGRPETLSELPAAQTVLFSVGFDRSAGSSIRDVYVTGLKIILSHVPANVARFIYISTTGVYGEHGDDWVDEDTSCDPQTEGARAHWTAEQLLMSQPIGQRAVILRMAGLYGPGRIPRRDELLAGKPIAAAASGFVNLIHIDDAASAVIAADERATPPRTYVVSDGHPTPRRQYLQNLAQILGAPPPQFIDNPPPPAATRGSASKRILNRRVLSELDIRLEFPTFYLGLRQCIDCGQ